MSNLFSAYGPSDELCDVKSRVRRREPSLLFSKRWRRFAEIRDWRGQRSESPTSHGAD